MREARYWTVAWVASALFLNSCVVVPTRDGAAAIDVNAVITRVKCDLKNIVLQKANTTLADGSRPFLFLRSWAAKVHLTVAIDASSSINPGASITEPLHIVNNVAQSFTLGVGGGLTTEAIRQEDVEFLVSFPDIDREFRNGSMREFYERCPSEPGVLLQSDLGLDRLIESALKPVENGVLRPGHNVGPGAGAPPPIPTPDLPRLAAVKKEDEQAHHKQFGNASFIDLKKASPKSDKLGQVLSGFFDVKPEFQGMDAKQLQQNSTAPEKSDLEKAEAEKAKIARTLLANSTEATELETKTQAIINNIVKPRYAIAGGSFDQSCLGPVSEAQLRL